MGATRFDHVMRGLARSTTRRRGVIAGLGALGAGVLAAATTAAAPQSRRKAPLPGTDAHLQIGRLPADGHRPRYHYLPPANWMNDPNGVIEWEGTQHLFYQYNPDGASWGNIHWGHAVSDDLIHWTDLPIALAPTPGGPDERGCFSGCAVDDDGVPTILYTGARGVRYQVQTQCLATSRDNLLTWQKDSRNPVLSEIPAVAGPTHDFRDPFVWRDGETWYMALASRIVGVGGVVFLYRSPDLHSWEYLHPLLAGDAASTGDVWECPNFFPLDDKWVLLVSGEWRDIPSTVFFFIGDYADHTFTPEVEGVLDYGYVYAPLTMRDSRGRRLLWSWLREGRSAEAYTAAGWAGVQAIPRQLSLRQGTLAMEPAPELKRIRGDRIELSDVRLDGQAELPVGSGSALDIVARFASSGPVGLVLAAAPDGSEQTRITYDPGARQLLVDRGRSSLLGGIETYPHVAPHELAPGEALELRVLLDGSVIEIIANGRTSISTRVYPSRADSQGVRVFGQGLLQTMTIWQMASIWPS
jgi:beta-fructofuranosidase